MKNKGKTRLRVIRPGEETEHPQAEPRTCLLLKKASKGRPKDRMISKFGALPYLTGKDDWPACLGCGEALTFVFQLRSDDMKNQPKGFPRMLSFYYCFACKPWWDVDGKGFQIDWRMIDPQAELFRAKDTPVTTRALVTPTAISLTDADDYPGVFDDRSWGDLDAHSREMLARRLPNRETSKLEGYPAWMQKPDLPSCRFCGGEMDFMGQISSGEFHGIQWPDDGRLYLFGCRNNCSDKAFSIVVQGE